MPICLSRFEAMNDPSLIDWEAMHAGTAGCLGDILFDFDKWNIRTEAEPTLRQVAEVITQHPRGAVLIEGHTDAKGADSYNVPLSQKRADVVKAWLVNKGGVAVTRMLAKGWGKAKPVAPNTNPDGSDNPEGRQKNRRVEVTVRK